MSASALLQRARQADMDVYLVGGQIKVDRSKGRPDSEHILAELKERKVEVLAFLTWPALDWRTHAVGKPIPCRLCGKPAMMRDSANLPCHKVCAEADIVRPRRRRK